MFWFEFSKNKPMMSKICVSAVLSALLVACGWSKEVDNPSTTPTEKVDKLTINEAPEVLDIATNSASVKNNINAEDWVRDIEFILTDENWKEYRNNNGVFKDIPEDTEFKIKTTALVKVAWVWVKVTSPENTFKTLKEVHTNKLPTVWKWETITITEGESATLVGNWTDEDGVIVDYRWTDENGNLIDVTKELTVFPSKTTKYYLEVIDNSGAKSANKAEYQVIVKPIVILNQAPKANLDSYTVAYGETKIFDVLANDTDENKSTLKVTGVENEVWGRFEKVGNKIKFTPEAGFSWEASATYIIEDEEGETSSTKIKVNVEEKIITDTIASINIEKWEVRENSVTLSLSWNDINWDKSFKLMRNWVVIKDFWDEIWNGEITFTDNWLEPATLYNYEFQFSAKNKDTWEFELKKATLEVRTKEEIILNQAPVANVDNFTVKYGETKTFDVLANDTDENKSTLKVTEVENEVWGRFEKVGNKIKFTPEAGFSWEASAIYIIEDEEGETSSTKIKVNVEEEIILNQAPVANVDNFTVAYGETKTLDVLANDTDENKSTLKIINIENEVRGEFEIVGNKIKFTPEAGFKWLASAIYTIEDEEGETSSWKIKVMVEEKEISQPTIYMADQTISDNWWAFPTNLPAPQVTNVLSWAKYSIEENPNPTMISIDENTWIITWNWDLKSSTKYQLTIKIENIDWWFSVIKFNLNVNNNF